jgi:hypothetical protein
MAREEIMKSPDLLASHVLFSVLLLVLFMGWTKERRGMESKKRMGWDILTEYHKDHLGDCR